MNHPPVEYQQDHVDRGGERIGVQRYPEPPGARALAVLWPAMGVPARYYRPFAAQLTEAGLAVAVADLRGTGASTPAPSRASRYGYADLAGDVGAVLEALKEQRDQRRTVLIGHSLGGQVCALHLALGGDPTGDSTGDPTGDSTVDGLVLVAVGMPYWRAYPGLHRYRVLGYTQWIGLTTAALGVWPGWTFGGRQAAGVIRDWARSARTGRYPAMGGADVEAALKTVRTPVLAVSVEGDAFTPASTMDHLVGKLRAAAVEREHYAAAQPIDHFKWVRAGGPLARRVAAWAEALPA